MAQHWQARRRLSVLTCRGLPQLPRPRRASHTYLSVPSELELQRNLAALPMGGTAPREQLP
jgi:hypothetical protein